MKFTLTLTDTEVLKRAAQLLSDDESIVLSLLVRQFREQFDGTTDTKDSKLKDHFSLIVQLMQEELRKLAETGIDSNEAFELNLSEPDH